MQIDKSLTLRLTIPVSFTKNAYMYLDKYAVYIVAVFLSIISILSYINYLLDGLGLAYNDARSHLDIGRRVVESLKPGLAQLGSVWLPLPHLLMIPTIWNDFFWHTGLSGAMQSMISFVITGILIYEFLKIIKVGLLGRYIAVLIFATNINILYLQSTAMTELLLIATMTAGVYELLRWEQSNKLVFLMRSSFWVMLSTLNRYDGWFLFGYAIAVISIITFIRRDLKSLEGKLILFCTLGGLGIVLWLLWNQLIFNDPLYFIYGPYSAHAQQMQLLEAGDLPTKGNLMLSIKTYLYALAYNSDTFIGMIAAVGVVIAIFDKRIGKTTKIALSALLAPLIFNILALFLGQSVLYVEGISGNTWFNVRYGIMLMPAVAVLVGYVISRTKSLKPVLIGLILLVSIFTFISQDAVTIDDARYGSSQKNVTQVSGWLHDNALHSQGFILISVASHDATVFSSGLPMSRFIHEGTGVYWNAAIHHPAHWARYIIMRTHDMNDLTYRLIYNNPELADFSLIHHYPFADIYELKPQYLSQLHTHASLSQTLSQK